VIGILAKFGIYMLNCLSVQRGKV